MVLCQGSPKKTNKGGHSSGTEEWSWGNGITDGQEKTHPGGIYGVILADVDK